MKSNFIKFTTLASVAAIALSATSVFAADLGANLGVSAGAAVNASSGAGLQTGAGANISASVGANAKTNVRIANRADQEITRRINALNALSARVDAMQKLSADEKNSLSSEIQAQIANLTDLQSKISADASSTTNLRADAQSVTGSYRIFALIIPRGAIIAASDRVMTIIDAMNALGVKLQARISAASSSGVNASSAVSTYNDFTAKISAAQTQAQTAVNEVASLQPDMGNQTQFQANLTALKDARAKIQASQQDLVAARKDAGAIVKIVAGFKASANASTTMNASGSASGSQQ